MLSTRARARARAQRGVWCGGRASCGVDRDPGTEGGVVTTPGITVIATPGAAAAAVMPGVSITPGQPEPNTYLLTYLPEPSQ